MGILDFLYKAISYKICVVYRMHSAHTELNSINYPHIYIDIISGAATVAVTVTVAMEMAIEVFFSLRIRKLGT